MTPLAKREDGGDMRPTDPRDLSTEQPRESLLSHLVKDCAA